MTDSPTFKNSTDYSSDPDVILMLDFQKGNTHSFEVLMKKFYPRVLNFIYRYGLNRHAAEDLTQEIFLKIFKMGPSYHPRAKFQTLLYTIVRNSALNAIRNEHKYAVSLDEEKDTEDGPRIHEKSDEKTPSPLGLLLEQEQSARIQSFIHELPENQRSALLLRRYEEMSYEEIAAAMNCSVMAVKSLLNRAKETLKVKMAGLLKVDEK